jgi:glutamyl/glutaminyl-tRNA synthetase
MQIARMLGRVQPPMFLHHALIMKTPVQKLSKSDGDTGVRELCALGWRPGQVIGRAAALASLIQHERDLAPDDVAGLFRDAP